MSNALKYTLAVGAFVTVGGMLGAFAVSKLPSAPEWLVMGAVQAASIYAGLRFAGA